MSAQGLNKRAVFRYVALPGIRPRFRELFGRGFQFVPYFMALVFECARLLPKNHPYLYADNLGRYGLRHVIAEAANNLVLDRKNADQIIVFGLILTALIIVFVQILLVFAAIFIQPVMALPPAPFPQNFSEFFVPGAWAAAHAGGGGAAQDIALILLDMVFGVPGMFESCADLSTLVACVDGQNNPILMSNTAAAAISGGSVGGAATDRPFWDFSRAAYPTTEGIHPIHVGLHQLFAVYSYGLLLIAVFITLYFMFVVVAETAQTGTAFGKRFNKVWAPIRIVVAFGLLVPIAFGMNSGQFIVLYAAKYGSGFATNGWGYFNDSLSTHYYDGVQQLVSVPNFPEFGALAQFYLAAATCKATYMLEGYVEAPGDVAGGTDHHIWPYLVRSPTATPDHLPLASPGAIPASVTAARDATSYDDLFGGVVWLDGANRLILRFGERDTRNYANYLGNVKPLCGEIVVNLEDSRPPADAEDGPETIQRYYWWMVKYMWWSEGQMTFHDDHHEYYAANAMPGFDIPATALEPDADFRSDIMQEYELQMREVLTGSGYTAATGVSVSAVDAQRASGSWDLAGSPLLDKGWAGAAIWYNRIAEMNGAVTSAIFNIPLPSKFPHLMEYVKNEKIQNDLETDLETRFKPRLPNGDEVRFPSPDDIDKAQAMYDAYAFWSAGNMGATTQTEPSGNVVIDSINAVLGTHGLYDMRKNADVHPLAQLVGVGRALVESSVRNLGFAAIGTAAGTLTKTMANFPGPLAQTGASFLITTAMIGLTAGFILYYIVPFLPFIYFFFAVGGWVKGIFEAMVGVPLWALAHIRIDGNGLPGQAAISGYFLIFEIFLRPILIVFGFLASILIFSAMVQVLNDIFDLVIGNLTGFDMHEELNDTGGTGVSYANFYRSAIDEFFFTLMYAVIVYMMGQSSFKLIDQIPNNILRWMNQNVATFNDQREDPAQGLVSTAQIGAQQGLSSMGGGLNKIVNAATS
ncbi:MAG: DotA/TraY family protein [Alphaproteobacteria bacterium]